MPLRATSWLFLANEKDFVTDYNHDEMGYEIFLSFTGQTNPLGSIVSLVISF